MGYIGARTRLLPEIIKKYAIAKAHEISEFSGDISGDFIALYHEVENWYSECELFIDEDYPGLTLEQLLPDYVVEQYQSYIQFGE